ncbi:hypothetical protein IW261DRAFT_1594696 [Armillaria novae-zelandiae]|uniref:Uncharacterized protein n=1 Tax=Armillaria novae-zelandiae TaxID=153914 RepID=A0AA39P3V7_9AGAR|nr:hypothetical protein IW261DRAFT_1594696 [Armillaria novae-zelandiae]
MQVKEERCQPSVEETPRGAKAPSPPNERVLRVRGKPKSATVAQTTSKQTQTWKPKLRRKEILVNLGIYFRWRSGRTLKRSSLKPEEDLDLDDTPVTQKKSKTTPEPPARGRFRDRRQTRPPTASGGAFSGLQRVRSWRSSSVRTDPPGDTSGEKEGAPSNDTLENGRIVILISLAKSYPHLGVSGVEPRLASDIEESRMPTQPMLRNFAEGKDFVKIWFSVEGSTVEGSGSGKGECSDEGFVVTAELICPMSSMDIAAWYFHGNNTRNTPYYSNRALRPVVVGGKSGGGSYVIAYLSWTFTAMLFVARCNFQHHQSFKTRVGRLTEIRRRSILMLHFATYAASTSLQLNPLSPGNGQSIFVTIQRRGRRYKPAHIIQ